MRSSDCRRVTGDQESKRVGFDPVVSDLLFETTVDRAR
jgi:hypothetical protein